mmetsp:Transcript_5952/g.14704  ORF Transcript_5952/g.14704 Transcript_5952/m.14704 type:complete len:201 (-) Transcript_5952:4296-4898(-)
MQKPMAMPVRRNTQDPSLLHPHRHLTTSQFVLPMMMALTATATNAATTELMLLELLQKNRLPSRIGTVLHRHHQRNSLFLITARSFRLTRTRTRINPNVNHRWEVEVSITVNNNFCSNGSNRSQPLPLLRRLQIQQAGILDIILHRTTTTAIVSPRRTTRTRTTRIQTHIKCKCKRNMIISMGRNREGTSSNSSSSSSTA